MKNAKGNIGAENAFETRNPFGIKVLRVAAGLQEEGI
jgi:hypothetical protein